MASYNSHSSTSYANRTNTTVLAPSGIADGDVLVLLFVTVAASEPSITLPTGFALLAGFPSTILDGPSGLTATVRAAYKAASGESGDYTVTHSAVNTQAVMVCVRDPDAGATPVGTANTGTGATTTALGITTEYPDSLVIFLSQAWQNYGAASAPGGTTPTFTERVDAAGVLYCATGTWASAGATGDKTHTNPNGAPDPWTGVLVVVESPDPGSPVVDVDYSRFPKVFMRGQLR